MTKIYCENVYQDHMCEVYGKETVNTPREKLEEEVV